MRYIILVLVSFVIGTSPAFAGAGHNHGHGDSHAPISQAEAKTAGKEVIEKLINESKIDGSWAKISAGEATQKEFGGRTEWVVVFKNDGISDPEKRTLYVFLSLDGGYIAANYTGN
ncbi:MAG: DUF6488 family protein [Pseudomonadales bacterium]|nr:DUF6488 family protein [Pseudomonadales bacterium]